MDLKNLKNLKFFKKKINYNKGKSQINIDIYWRGILIFFVLAVLLSATYGFFSFLEANKDANLDIENNSHQEIIKKDRLEKTLKYFKARAERSRDVIISPVPISNPGI